MPTNAGGATATATESKKAPDFGPITYTKAGIYNYIIKETSTPTNGMANAEDVTATVTVTLNAESNKLEAIQTEQLVHREREVSRYDELDDEEFEPTENEESAE